MKDFAEVITALALTVLIVVAVGLGIAKLIQLWSELPEPPPPTEKWVGVCISDELSEEEYQKQYERADVEKLKSECDFRSLSRDILGCYGDDHYQFLCPIN